jgi:hypothetical protein
MENSYGLLFGTATQFSTGNRNRQPALDSGGRLSVGPDEHCDLPDNRKD